MNKQRKIFRTTVTYQIINPVEHKILDTQTEIFNHLELEEALEIFDDLDKNDFIEVNELKCEFEDEDVPF